MDTTAILSRTNLGLRPFEQALTEANVPYHLLGRAGFWAQNEVRTSLAFLGCSLYPSDYLLSQAIRAPFAVTKFLPKTKLAARLKELKDEDTSYWNLLTQEPHSLVENKNLEALNNFVQFIHALSRYRDLPPGDALKKILESLRAWDYYAEEESSGLDNDPVANLVELCKLAAKHQTVKEFLDYCRKVTAASKSKKGVALATVHGAKGLEFHTVFLVGVQEGLMPHAKSTDLGEERAIFFVGASRAEKRLILSYSGQPSPFLKDFQSKKPETVV
jgi:DNA helicase-2/ATP-dependent DNA helicase PcrA